eukprot:scaffold79441_cov42-Phaeocystis_antarctica.AAC.1
MVSKKPDHAASTARWQGKVRPPITTLMSAKRSSPSKASIRVARRPGIANLPLTESSAAAADWRHAWMAVVGWFEAGGALRISPRFFESASWIRFERSCSILEQPYGTGVIRSWPSNASPLLKVDAERLRCVIRKILDKK